MDAYECEKIDKEMSRKMDAIYTDPNRHRFYSCFDFHAATHSRGPRGGQVRARKTICYYCGLPEKGHAEKDEEL